MAQIEAHCSSLTKDDSFVLHFNNSVVVFTPVGSNDIEKKKAVQFGSYISIVQGLRPDQLILISKS